MKAPAQTDLPGLPASVQPLPLLCPCGSCGRRLPLYGVIKAETLDAMLKCGLPAPTAPRLKSQPSLPGFPDGVVWEKVSGSRTAGSFELTQSATRVLRHSFRPKASALCFDCTKIAVFFLRAMGEEPDGYEWVQGGLLTSPMD